MIFFAVVSLVLARLEPKMRNGSPTTFAEHRLPEVELVSEREHSNFFEAYATANNGVLEYIQDLDVDSTDFFAMSFLSKHLKNLDFELIAPDGSVVDLTAHQQTGSYPLNDDGTTAIPALNFAFQKPQQGVYKFRVSAPYQLQAALDSPIPVQKNALGVLITYNDSPVEILSRLSSYELEVGVEVGLVSQIVGDKNNVAPLVNSVDDARMAIISPDGTERYVQMWDDGAHADGAANDGVYGGLFAPSVPGQYVWRAQLSGQHNGVRFQRSTQHLVRVATVDAALGNSGVAFHDSGRIAVKFGVQLLSKLTAAQAKELKLHTYAELWQVGGSAIGWAMAALPVVDNSLTLTFDARWFARAKVDLNALASGVTQFELRNVYLSEMTGFVPISTADIITLSVKEHNLIATAISVVDANSEDDDLWYGPKPRWIEESYVKAAASGAASDVVLVHGYCSSSNPFVGKGHNWRQAHVFEDFGQNLPNDAFAKKLDAFTESKGLTAFSGIGHSQGGIALVHLESTYWSGLDVALMLRKANTSTAAASKRAIQSVGTPYHGCTGAGSGANLIELFGIACGSNSDLTPDGAKLWLATVAPQAAKETHFYTTVALMKTGWFDSCNFATNMVLESPNDGTTELGRTVLAGATNSGNTIKQCHTEGMNYPAQTSDAKRNAEMDAYAI